MVGILWVEYMGWILDSFNFEVENLWMRTFGCDARTDCWMVGYGIGCWMLDIWVGYMGWILDGFLDGWLDIWDMLLDG